MGFIFEENKEKDKQKQKGLNKKKTKDVTNKSVTREQKSFEAILQQYVASSSYQDASSYEF